MDEARLRLEEFYLEISLTGRPHLVVEGATDSRFIRGWLSTVEGGSSLAVTAVDSLHVDFATLSTHGLTEGARSRVIAVALDAEEEDLALRCLVDRDTGHDVTLFNASALIWTDFPSLESYGLKREVLDLANLLHFNERFSSVLELMAGLEFALRELFAVRLKFPNLAQPNVSAGLERRRPNLSEFDVSKAVSGRARAEANRCSRPEASDPREFAYGHDVAALLLATDPNYFKNTLGLTSAEALEGVLRMAMLAEGSFQNEPAFIKLRDWLDECA